METTVRDYPLSRPLPAEVLVGGDAIWSRYHRYPVFSARWLRGRCLVFGSVIALFSLVAGFGTGAATRDWSLAVLAGGHMFLAFLFMATAGPALATLVRYRRWPVRRERVGLVLAVLLGMAGSFLVDRWASGYVETRVRAAMVEQGLATEKKPEFEPAVKPVLMAINGLVLVVVYGLFGGGLALRAYFSEGRRWAANQRAQELRNLRAAKQQSDLRLGLLQAQVEPHFLFNTLASVRALVRQDPAQAEATLDALVDHLRATIPKLRADGESLLHSTLGQQLDICASYLALMKLRMGGRLSFAVEADSVLRAQPFPPLLLLTLVENAIKHGIEPQPGPGRIEVRASARGEHLVVSVVDDGAGLKPGLGSGVGLVNVREQLAARYGAAATFSLRGLAGGRGAVATISVPVEEPAA
ncbi:sensor histidine kinase [Arenimonas fontis]|uniref:Sensor histidine kinase n=1 Tax=Arenimonas fontis TaxID=2608255 RepID=A0A5B2ZFC5_9GAMM|nr:histidine kinase [Arenimonas fontis]KAA2285802.1 sensor histidine kinase [Arenimonas fontis]